jgi:DNA-binding transcriptional LysR family regulator
MDSRLGVPLVNRTTRRVSLTPDGEVLLAHARRILGEIADPDQLLSASKDQPRGQFPVPADRGLVLTLEQKVRPTPGEVLI